MPRGPHGERRPADVVGCAITVAKVATGEIEESSYVVPGRVRSGKAGAAARMKRLTQEERAEIAKIAAEARWTR
ncbi:MAG: RNA-binding protein [Proteobacteria bacterium]|nr:RNA-binding protein [Pseudomonadota bacterium]